MSKLVVVLCTVFFASANHSANSNGTVSDETLFEVQRDFDDAMVLNDGDSGGNSFLDEAIRFDAAIDSEIEAINRTNLQAEDDSNWSDNLATDDFADPDRLEEEQFFDIEQRKDDSRLNCWTKLPASDRQRQSQPAPVNLQAETEKPECNQSANMMIEETGPQNLHQSPAIDPNISDSTESSSGETIKKNTIAIANLMAENATNSVEIVNRDSSKTDLEPDKQYDVIIKNETDIFTNFFNKPLKFGNKMGNPFEWFNQVESLKLASSKTNFEIEEQYKAILRNGSALAAYFLDKAMQFDKKIRDKNATNKRKLENPKQSIIINGMALKNTGLTFESHNRLQIMKEHRNRTSIKDTVDRIRFDKPFRMAMALVKEEAENSTAWFTRMGSIQEKLEIIINATIFKAQKKLTLMADNGKELSRYFLSKSHDFDKGIRDGMTLVMQRINDVINVLPTKLEGDVANCAGLYNHLMGITNNIHSRRSICIAEKLKTRFDYITNVNRLFKDEIAALSIVKHDTSQCNTNTTGVKAALNTLSCLKKSRRTAARITTELVNEFNTGMTMLNFLSKNFMQSLAPCMTSRGVTNFHKEASTVMKNTIKCIEQYTVYSPPQLSETEMMNDSNAPTKPMQMVSPIHYVIGNERHSLSGLTSAVRTSQKIPS